MWQQIDLLGRAFSSGERKDLEFPGRYLGTLSVAVTKELMDTGKSNKESNDFLQFWRLHIEMQGSESNENVLAQEGFQQSLHAVHEHTREGVCFSNKATPPSLGRLFHTSACIFMTEQSPGSLFLTLLSEC